MAPTHYDILGIAKTATPDEIKAARNKKLKENHPDLVGKSHEEMAKSINIAYTTLHDDQKRAEYDLSLMFKPRTTPDFGFERPRPQGPTPSKDRASDLKEKAEDLKAKAFADRLQRNASVYAADDRVRPITYSNIFNLSAKKIFTKLAHDFRENSSSEARKIFQGLGACAAVLAFTDAMITIPSHGPLSFMVKTAGAVGIAYTTGNATSLSRYLTDGPGIAAGIIGNIAGRTIAAYKGDISNPARQCLFAGILTSAFAMAGGLGAVAWVGDEAFDLGKQIVSHDVMGYDTRNHSRIYDGAKWIMREMQTASRP